MTATERLAWQKNVQQCAYCEKYKFKSEMVVLEIEGAVSEVCRICSKVIEGQIIGRLADRHGLPEAAAIYLAKKYRRSVQTLDKRGRYLCHEIDLDHLYRLYRAQKGLCAISGEKMTFRDGPAAASIDWINNRKGYEPDNVWWVCSTVNMMKLGMSAESLGLWCAKIALHLASKGRDLENEAEAAPPDRQIDSKGRKRATA